MRNRKRKNAALAMLLAAVLLCMAGCMNIKGIKEEFTLNVHWNGTYDLHYVYAFQPAEDTEPSDEGSSGDKKDEPSDEDLFEDLNDNIRSTGYTVIQYDDDTFKGFAIEKEQIPFTEKYTSPYLLFVYLSSFDGEDDEEHHEELGEEYGALLFTRTGLHYTLRMEDVGYAGEESDEGSASEPDDTSESVANVTLTLPFKPIRHNATSVSENGKTLTWDLFAFDSDEDIFCEFTDPQVLLWSFLGVLILAAGIIVTVLCRKAAKHRRKQQETGAPESTPQGGTDKTFETADAPAAETAVPAAETGAPVTDTDTPAGASSAPAAEQVRCFCTGCGRALTEADKFCPGCGTKRI